MSFCTVKIHYTCECSSFLYNFLQPRTKIYLWVFFPFVFCENIDVPVYLVPTRVYTVLYDAQIGVVVGLVVLVEFKLARGLIEGDHPPPIWPLFDHLYAYIFVHKVMCTSHSIPGRQWKTIPAGGWRIHPHVSKLGCRHVTKLKLFVYSHFYLSKIERPWALLFL
jgi:hypothetical protein